MRSNAGSAGAVQRNFEAGSDAQGGLRMAGGWYGRRGLFVVAVMLVALIGIAGAAQAITFNYSNQGGFTIGTETGTDFTATVFTPPAGTGLRFFGPQPDNSPTLTGTQYSTIGWGFSVAPTSVTLVDPIGQANTSALKIETIAGTVSDDGVPKPVALLTHQNSGIEPRFLN